MVSSALQLVNRSSATSSQWTGLPLGKYCSLSLICEMVWKSISGYAKSYMHRTGKVPCQAITANIHRKWGNRQHDSVILKECKERYLWEFYLTTFFALQRFCKEYPLYMGQYWPTLADMYRHRISKKSRKYWLFSTLFDSLRHARQSAFWYMQTYTLFQCFQIMLHVFISNTVIKLSKVRLERCLAWPGIAWMFRINPSQPGGQASI